nr:GNAT family N-acetyltransferase [Roseospira visakhapatnamensis]
MHAACFADQPWHRPWDRAAMDSILALPGVAGWLAVHEAPPAPVGLLLVQAVVDEADILTLGVLPGCWRRRGIARRLLAHGDASLRAAGVTRWSLEVAEDNAGAVSFYRAHGFVEVGRRRGYFTGEPGRARDALVMARALTTPESDPR